MHGVPHFAISIALQIKGEIMIGLIFDPIKNEIFYAEKNNGSFVNNSRIRTSNKSNIEECLFASNNALDLAYVGCGRLDGFFHNKINLWDIAAGKIIVEEAGGRINEIQNFKSKIDIRAANPNIYEKMLNKLDNF